MQKIFENIRNRIRQDSSFFSNRQRLRNLLNDYFSQKPIYINLLMTAYDDNIAEALKKYPSLDTPLLERLSRRLVDRYGINESGAKWAIVAWFKIFNRPIKVDEKPADPSAQGSPRPGNNLPPGVRSIPNFGPGSKSVQPQPSSKGKPSSKNSSTFDLLKRIFKQNFPNVPQWALWEGDITEKTSLRQMPNDDELKQIALNVICHGQYRANEIIHLRINDQCTSGWALTKDSFCTGGANIGEHTFKYAEINSLVEVAPMLWFSDDGGRLNNFLEAAKKIVDPNGNSFNHSANFNQMVLEIINDNGQRHYHKDFW